MTSEHWSIRKTERREGQVRELGVIAGLGDDFSAVIDFALSTALAQYWFARTEQEATMGSYTMDSGRLDEVVSDFRSHPQGDAGATLHDVREHLLNGDRPEDAEYQDWLDTADVDEIVDSLVSVWFTEC